MMLSILVGLCRSLFDASHTLPHSGTDCFHKLPQGGTDFLITDATMIILLNGAFGVGKSTVAKLLRGSIPGSAVYDPEWAGSVLMRLPTLNERLSKRRVAPQERAWVTRRNLECAAAHIDSHFGEPVETDERTAFLVAEHIISRMKSYSSRRNKIPSL